MLLSCVVGLRKDLHIEALLALPEVASAWKAKHNRKPTAADAKALFKRFIPLQLQVLKQYTTLIPGTAQTTDELRSKYGLKIGVSTGFQRVMADVLLAEAKVQGFVPDSNVAGGKRSQTAFAVNHSDPQLFAND